MAAIDPAPGEAHNYFALLEYLPGDLLRRIVKSHGCSPAAFKVASLLGVDLVESVLASCLPTLPVMPKDQTLPQQQTSANSRRPTTEVSRDPAEGRDTRGPTSAEPAFSRDEASRHTANAREKQGLKVAQETSNRGGPASSSAPNLGQSTRRKAKARGSFDDLATPDGSWSEIVSLLSRAGLREGGVVLNGVIPDKVESQKRNERRPYGAEIEAEELSKVMASRKARLPGMPATEDAPGCLTMDLLAKIASVAPLRAFCAAVVTLFYRHQCLHEGPIPLLPLSLDSMTLSDPSPAAKPGRSLDLGSLPDKQQSERERQARQKLRAEDQGVTCSASDAQLLDFAKKVSADKFSVLHQWLGLQIEAIDSLRDLDAGDLLNIHPELQVHVLV